MERQSAVVMTPEEDRELKFPVRVEQPSSRTFTPVQIAVLFLQFCLVGVFLGAIISNDPDQKDVAPLQKVLVVTVERERKAGGGYKYKFVAGKKGGIEAIMLEKLSANDLSAPIDNDAEQPTTITVGWETTSATPVRLSAHKQAVSGPPQTSITKDVSMPSPPVPPPWSFTAPPVPLLSGVTSKQQSPKEKSTKRPSFKFNYNKNDFYRG